MSLVELEPTFVDVPVVGGPLRVARWGDGEKVVLAAHGITASSIGWRPVARHLPAGWTLLAPDLRGRGGSAALGPPYGMQQHADDLAAVADHLGIQRAVVAGQSMGGFVAVALARSRPELVERLVLVDGGLPLPFELEGTDPDAVIELTLGPALARLSMTFEDADAYIAFWREHPALAQDWHDDLEAYVRYDLVGDVPALRSSAQEDAVRADGRDMLVGSKDLGAALTELTCPVHLIRAPAGLLGEPPGVQPTELVDVWRERIASFTDELVEGTNHYTVAFGERGARVIAARIAEAWAH